MEPFLRQLAELCQAEKTRAKWVFVPSHALGHTLGERLVLDGTSWANLRFTPPLDVALQIAAPFLLERGIEPAADELGPALIVRLLLGLPPSTPRYFRDLAEQPKMAEALWSTLRELRMAGLGSADLVRAKFESREKAAELGALVAAYQAYLADSKLADVAAVYQEALRHLDVGPVLAGDVLTELPDVVWSPLERRFLDALPGNRVTPRALGLPGLERPRRLAGHCERVGPQPASDSERLAFLMSPAEAPAPLRDGSVELFKAGGREAEAEEVLRRILRDAVPLDHVEVACTVGADAALFWEKAQRHELPVTIGPGVPVTLTRPARALLAFCEWMADGLPASGLRRLLQSGDVRLSTADGPTPGQAARLLARSDATWGRETYAPAMVATAASYRERADDAESDDELKAYYLEAAARAEALGAWIARLLELVPEERDGLVRLDAVLGGCASFLADIAAKSSELDGEATVALRESLAGLGVLGLLERPLREALALIRHQVEGLAVGRDRARPGHLFVTTLQHAGRSGRPRAFVIGLEEGRVLPVALEDAVLLDDERASISPALATSRDRVSEALYTVVSRLGALSGHVCLSFSSRDLREYRETFPSWLVLQAVRVLEPEREWTYEKLQLALGEPASVVPVEPSLALSDAGWWLSHLRGVGPKALPPVYAAFPRLAQGEAAEAERDSDRFTVYDGLVPAAGPALDPRVAGGPVSASSLQDLAGCPFRHFLQRGLRLDPRVEAEPDRDHWLDPSTRGHVLHALYAEILREIRAEGAVVDPERHFPLARDLAVRNLAELCAQMPPPSGHVFERETQEILDDLALFLRFEAEGRREAIGFEVSFGAGDPEGEPLAQPDPVTIDLGGGLVFRLRGRIDRIDRLGDGTYEVIDYKTGFYQALDFRGTFQGGRLLQHALYALAAMQLLRKQDPGARVSRSCYYLPTVRGGGERAVCPPVTSAQVATVLRDLFDLVAGGAFVHTSEPRDCRWCGFGDACGARPLERAKAKIANEANRMLAPYRRLAQHE